MRLHLLAVGTRMPGWVRDGFEDYARRLPRQCALTLVEIPTGPRTRSADPARARTEEGRKMLRAIPQWAYVVALEERGRAFDTRKLAARLQEWMDAGRGVTLLAGGPDGLAEPCRERADLAWSLSPLTLPHGLVRVVVAEQVYRAWSLLGGHPYHRE